MRLNKTKVKPMNRDIMIAAGFGDAVARMENKQCTTCGIPVNEKTFVDEISVREFDISGMCQSCQDDYFRDQDPADYFTGE